MQKLDWIVLAICLGMAWPTPGLAEPFLSLIEKHFSQFARHKRAALAAIGLATIVTRLALLPWMPVPQPKIHDEFSYLLAGDTFAHGRLVNPPHPMSFFLDTFHVIQHPSYASMYPPAQGMMLAIGQLLGNPWIGVLLSIAAMCVAMTWMFQGWMPPEWALVGGILVFLRFGLFSYWMNSYWGGAVGATGAALVLGALPRILEFRRPRDPIIFGLGAAILATSRPVEGFIFCLPLTAALVWWILRRETPGHVSSSRRVFAPIAMILLCVVGFVGYYNSRVTGSPIIFPHFIEQRMYFTTPVFLWGHDQPRRTYANPQFDDFYNNFMPSLYQTGWDQAVGQFWWKATEFWQFFLGPALSIPFLAPQNSPVASAGCALRDRTLGRCVLPRALCRTTRSEHIFALDARNAPHARLVFARTRDRRCVDEDNRALQLISRAGVFRTDHDVQIEFTFRFFSAALCNPPGSDRMRAYDFQAGIFAHSA